MQLPETGGGAARGGGSSFWCAFWVVSLIAFGLLIWQYAAMPQDAPFWEAEEGDYGPEDGPGPEAEPDPAPGPLEGADHHGPPPPNGGSRVVERPEPPEPVVIAPEPRFIAGGRYVAQLGAYRSERTVRPTWDRLARQAPSLFEEARLDIERTESKERGILYRMRAGYFADHTNAERFCRELRSVHRDCVVRQR
jgi:hypothetical protein